MCDPNDLSLYLYDDGAARSASAIVRTRVQVCNPCGGFGI